MTATESVLELNEVLKELVLGPWEARCAKAERPWEVPAGLLSDWEKHLQDEDPYVSFSAAIGLLRASNATPQARLFSEMTLFYSLIPLIWVVIAEILLAGARPPFCFLSTFFYQELKRPDPRHVAAYAAMHRHPSPENPIHPANAPEALRYFTLLNPARKLKAASPGDQPWHRAGLSLFEATGSSRGDVLCGLAELLKERGPSRHDASNPDANAIWSVASDDPFCRAWRTLNPLLVPPWQMHLPPASHYEFEELCLLGLVGYPIALLPQMAKTSGVLAQHPSFALKKAFFQGRQPSVNPSPRRPKIAAR